MSTLTLWEYKTFYNKSDTNDRTIQGKLNWFGAEGWELVSVVFETYNNVCRIHTYFFKRPIL